MSAVELGDLCDFANGGTPSKAVATYWNGSLPWITSADIDDGAVTLGRSFISGEGLRDSAATKVDAGTILFVSRTGVGKVAEAPTALSFSQDITAIKPNRSRLHSRYALRFLEANKAHFDRHARGATIKGVTREVISRLKIPLPPLDEQRRIAAILDKADALSRKRKRTLELLENVTRARFVEMFGNETRLVELASICSKITDGTHQAPKWANEGIPFLFVSNVRNQSISFDTKKFVSVDEHRNLTKSAPIEIEDVLYTAVGSYGHAAVVETTDRFVFQRHIAHIKPLHSRVCSIYLSSALESPSVVAQADKVARGVAQKTVTLDSLKKFLIPLPSIERQREFVEFAKWAREKSESVSVSRAGFDQLFTSLQHRAFSGQL